MYTEHNNHTEALMMLHTGKIFPGRPTLGSWVSYALGTENQNLPAYVVLRDPEGYNTGGDAATGTTAGCPRSTAAPSSATQGTPVLESATRPTRCPTGVAAGQPRSPGAARTRSIAGSYPRESELEARIRNYELAARMQLAAGEVLDLSNEIRGDARSSTAWTTRSPRATAAAA